jgi:hypothetical protein
MQGTTGQQPKTLTLEQAMNDLWHRAGKLIVTNEQDAQQIDNARRALGGAIPATKFLIHRMQNPPRSSGLLVPNP